MNERTTEKVKERFAGWIESFADSVCDNAEVEPTGYQEYSVNSPVDAEVEADELMKILEEETEAELLTPTTWKKPMAEHEREFNENRRRKSR